MNKKLLISIITAIMLVSILASCIPVQAAPNTSFIIYGQTKVGNAEKNGVEVTVTNEDTGEELTTTSATDDFGNVGYYSVNLGNMPTQWSRGDNITITFKLGTTRSSEFEIPDTGTIYKQDYALPASSRGGGRERGVTGDVGQLYIPIFIIFFIIIGVALWIYGSGNVPTFYVVPPAKKKKKEQKTNQKKK